ncbi:MAG TPA: VOC family protein [Gammaproteobacteria bacterium]|nr:VOC family protein [Gammaproteobacteria bacterium]
MIDHASLAVKDYTASLKFYDETLALLGYERLVNVAELPTAGYGKNQKPSFWISPLGNKEETIGNAKGLHISFMAPNAKAIDAWYAKCLELGGTSNGEPGPRHHYHPGYYGAFIIDPNGWRIEACFHQYQAK